MAKKHYTKASAKRACNSITSKIRNLHADDYISSKLFISMTDQVKRIKNSIK